MVHACAETLRPTNDSAAGRLPHAESHSCSGMRRMGKKRKRRRRKRRSRRRSRKKRRAGM